MPSLTLNDHLRALYDILADQIEESLTAAMIEAAAAGVAKPIALAADFAPLQLAIDRIKSRTPVAGAMRSAEWADVPLQIRNRAQFSAGVESARVMQDVQMRLEADLGWTPGVAKGREAFIRDVRATLEKEGFATNPQGGLTDITSNKRLALIHDMQTREARNYAKWKIDQDPDLLAAAPAQELVRVRRSAVPRAWPERWVRAGGNFAGGRMIAHKLDPVWMAISRFGNPWPPFDFGSGMGVEDVLASDAALAGVQPPDPDQAVTERGYNDAVEAEVRELPADKVAWLQDRLGGQVSVEDGVVRLSPLTWRSEADAAAWATRAYPPVRVSDAERAALKAWQGHSAEARERVAEQIRNRSLDNEAMRREIQAMDALIARSHAAESGIVYRAVDLAGGGLRLEDAAHTATTLSEQIAWQRVGAQAASPALVKIYLPKGSRGVYLPRITGAKGAEFLLQRGTKLRQVSERMMQIDGRQVRVITAAAEQAVPGAL